MKRKIIVGVVILVSALGLGRGIDWQFAGPNAANIEMYSLAAHNYLKFGYLKTKLLPVVEEYEELPGNPQYYVHHPPLLSLTISVLYRCFGENYPAARLSQILPVMITGWALYRLTQNGWVVLAYGLIPATVVFGRNTGLESLTIMWISLTAWAAASNKIGWAGIFSALGTLTDWPAAYFAGWLAWGLWRSKLFKSAVIIFLAALITGSLFLGYVGIISGGLGEIGSGILIPAGFWWRWPAVLVIRWGMYFGPIGLMGLIGLIRLKKNKIIFALTAFAATNMVLYPGWSFGHPYWIYYFVPAAAMGAGWCLSRIKNRNMMIGVLIISLIWWGRIESWKTGQIKTSLPAVTEVGNQTAANETKEEQQAKPAAIIEAKLLDILKVPQI